MLQLGLVPLDIGLDFVSLVFLNFSLSLLKLIIGTLFKVDLARVILSQVCRFVACWINLKFILSQPLTVFVLSFS